MTPVPRGRPSRPVSNRPIRVSGRWGSSSGLAGVALDTDALGLLRLCTTAVVFFVTGFVYACQDVRYALQGRTTMAVVDKVEDKALQTAINGGVETHYHFVDAHGRTVRDSVTYPGPAQEHVGDRLEVVYFPHDSTFNLAVAHRRWGPVIFFVFTTAVGAALLAWIIWKTSRDIRQMEAKDARIAKSGH